MGDDDDDGGDDKEAVSPKPLDPRCHLRTSTSCPQVPHKCVPLAPQLHLGDSGRKEYPEHLRERLMMMTKGPLAQNQLCRSTEMVLGVLWGVFKGGGSNDGVSLNNSPRQRRMWHLTRFGDKEAGEETGGPEVLRDGTRNGPPSHSIKGEAKTLPLPPPRLCPQLAPSIRDWGKGGRGLE